MEGWIDKDISHCINNYKAIKGVFYNKKIHNCAINYPGNKVKFVSNIGNNEILTGMIRIVCISNSRMW